MTLMVTGAGLVPNAQFEGLCKEPHLCLRARRPTPSGLERLTKKDFL